MKTAGSRVWDAAGALTLFAVNAYIALRLFHVAYTRQMGSIEAAFISLARYIRDHFPHLSWFPLWYGGIPFPDTYSPLLPFAAAGVSAATGATVGLAYHALTAAAYSLAPVALFWAAAQLGAGRDASFAAALAYSLISPSCWLVHAVRDASGGWFGPWRLVTLVRYGEGPHVLSLLFLPLAIAFLHRALGSRKPHHFVLAALAMSAAVLSNWIGAFALALALGAYLLAGYHRDWLPTWLRGAAVVAYAYALSMPWVSPSTSATIFSNAPRLVGFKSSAGHVLVAVAFAAGALLLAWILKRCGVSPQARFAALFLFGTAGISLGAGWFGWDMLPQANRYFLELDLAFWLAAAVAAEFVFLHIRRRALVAMLCAAAVITTAVALHQRRMAREMEAPIAIESTAEFRVSRWLGEHLPGRRVFAPGSISFWMDAFSDTPMLVGGFDNGIRNQLLWDVNFQVLFGDQLPVAIEWLKAFGCDAIVGSDAASKETFHPYVHPEKLQSLEALWRDGPEVIYAVPRLTSSLAHAVRPEDLVAEVPLAYDPKPLAPYLAALDNPALPAAFFEWRDPGAATISADLRAGDLLSVQVTWDRGWRATVDGRPRRVWSDKLGQVVIEPLCDGACTVQLTFDGGLETWVARWVSLLALAAGALWMLRARLRRRVALR